MAVVGFGAGAGCDGQVLVIDDAIGLTVDPAPISNRFGDVKGELERAVAMAERPDVPGNGRTWFALLLLTVILLGAVLNLFALLPL